MVIHTRLRAILFPLALYTLSAMVGSFFVWHGMNGERGLKTRVVNKSRILELNKELADLRRERAALERRAAMMQPASVDRDLLDEEARITLGRLHRNDLVVLLPPTPAR